MDVTTQFSPLAEVEGVATRMEDRVGQRLLDDYERLVQKLRQHTAARLAELGPVVYEGPRQSERAKVFLAEVQAVCEKHELSLGHEDDHGAFLVEEYSAHNQQWLRHARDETLTEEERNPWQR